MSPIRTTPPLSVAPPEEEAGAPEPDRGVLSPVAGAEPLAAGDGEPLSEGDAAPAAGAADVAGGDWGLLLEVSAGGAAPAPVAAGAPQAQRSARALGIQAVHKAGARVLGRNATKQGLTRLRTVHLP
jgi:hypothetical protein